VCGKNLNIVSLCAVSPVVHWFSCYRSNHAQYYETPCSTNTEVQRRPRTHFTQPVPLSFDTLHSSLQITAFWNNLARLYNTVSAKIPRAPGEKGCCSGLEVGSPIHKTLYAAYVTFPTYCNRQYCTFYVTSTLTQALSHESVWRNGCTVPVIFNP